MKISRYNNFITESKIDVPEFSSIEEIDGLSSYKVNNREFTPSEKKLVDDYISQFESVFLLDDETIKDILLDIDLIVPDIKMEINKVIVIPESESEKSTITEFEARNEIKDLNSLLYLKRWYDKFLTSEIEPFHSIIIQKSEEGGRKPFDNEAIYQFIDEIKETFSSMVNCKVELDKGGSYSMSLKLIYPKTIIKRN
jgi:hypothetical protein